MTSNKLTLELSKKLALLDKEIKQVTPSIYSSIGIALSENGCSAEFIEQVFMLLQNIWEQNQQYNTINKMIAMCEEKTGILLKYNEK